MNYKQKTLNCHGHKKKEKSTTSSSHLTNLINQLSLDIKNNRVHNIKNLQGLFTSLTKLQNIIGMSQLKESIAKQTSYLINKLNAGQFKMSMLNTILYGGPGLGKTKVGVILAEIWFALGFLQRAVEQHLSFHDYLNDFLRQQPPEILQLYLFIFIYIFLRLYDLVIYPFWIEHGFIMTAMLFLLFSFIIYLLSPLIINYYDAYKIKNENIIEITSRTTFVDKYLGGTSEKTENFLKANVGKVIFIDEAYSLYNGHQDSYGAECLDVINRFMSEHDNEIIIIMAGYEEKLKESLFKIQPGLNRRFTWQFHFENYTGEELYDIYKLQLAEEKCYLSPRDEEDILKFFIKHEKNLSHGGGDTKKLTFFTILNKLSNPEVITFNDVKKGMTEFLLNNNMKHEHQPTMLDEFKKYL